MNLYTDLQNKIKRQREVDGERIEIWSALANEAIKRYENLENLASVETRFSELLTLRKKMSCIYPYIVEFVDLIHGAKTAILSAHQRLELDRFDRWIKNKTQLIEEINNAITLAEQVEKIYAEINEARERLESFARFFELKPIERAVLVMEHLDATGILEDVEEVRAKLDDLLESITLAAQG